MLCQLSLLLMLYADNAGPLIVYAAVGQSAVALCHINNANAVGKAADTQRRNVVVHPGQLLEFHLSQIIQAEVDADIRKNLPCNSI